MSTDISANVALPGMGEVATTVTDHGEGHPILLLHGGGGSMTVSGFADEFAADEAGHARVIVPVHPGFDGTSRPGWLDNVPGLAALYITFLEDLGLEDVTVVGNSLGGWIAAEMATIGSARVSSYAIVDGIGLDVPDHPPVDFASLSPAEIAQRTYFDPDRAVDISTLPPEVQRNTAANMATLGIYAGETSTDPALQDHLASVEAPVLVAWGEADGIVVPDYGRAYAAAIPAAEFQLLPEAGHLPQLEIPGKLIEVLWAFADRHATRKPGR